MAFRPPRSWNSSTSLYRKPARTCVTASRFSRSSGGASSSIRARHCQPIAAPGGSEFNHGIHRNTRKRESESTSPFRVFPGGGPTPAGWGAPPVAGVVPWLPVCDDLSCPGNIRASSVRSECKLPGYRDQSTPQAARARSRTLRAVARARASPAARTSAMRSGWAAHSARCSRA